MSQLHRLLDDGAAHDGELRNGFSNHLPMALTALHALGADDARLSAFAARYADRLVPASVPSSVPVSMAMPGAGSNDGGWAQHLGQHARFAEYRAFFRARLRDERPEQLLPQVLPRLMEGCAAAAFHGLIRTAYGVMAQHLGELADGLAYWACAHAPLGPLPAEPGRETDPEALLRRLDAGRSTARSISARVRAAAADPALHRAVAQLAVNERTLAQLARLAAYAYAGSGNFTVLHLLTSAHALRVLMPHVPGEAAQRAALRWYWQAYAAAVVAARIERRPEPRLQPWRRIIAAALASDDDHVVKLVHSCREQAKVYGGVAWQYAASRVVVA